MAQIEIKGIDHLLAVLDSAIANFNVGVTEGMNELANELERLMKQYVPVRTGALRESIKAFRRGSLLVGISLLHYGLYVEEGTSKMAPQPFIRPAFQEIKTKVDKILWKHLDKYFMK